MGSANSKKEEVQEEALTYIFQNNRVEIVTFIYGYPKQFRVDIPPGGCFEFTRCPWESWIGIIKNQPIEHRVTEKDRHLVTLSSHFYPQKPGKYTIEPNNSISGPDRWGSYAT